MTTELTPIEWNERLHIEDWGGFWKGKRNARVTLCKIILRFGLSDVHLAQILEKFEPDADDVREIREMIAKLESDPVRAYFIDGVYKGEMEEMLSAWLAKHSMRLTMQRNGLPVLPKNGEVSVTIDVVNDLRDMVPLPDFMPDGRGEQEQKDREPISDKQSDPQAHSALEGLSKHFERMNSDPEYREKMRKLRLW